MLIFSMSSEKGIFLCQPPDHQRFRCSHDHQTKHTDLLGILYTRYRNPERATTAEGLAAQETNVSDNNHTNGQLHTALRNPLENNSLFYPCRQRARCSKKADSIEICNQALKTFLCIPTPQEGGGGFVCAQAHISTTQAGFQRDRAGTRNHVGAGRQGTNAERSGLQLYTSRCSFRTRGRTLLPCIRGDNMGLPLSRRVSRFHPFLAPARRSARAVVVEKHMIRQKSARTHTHTTSKRTIKHNTDDESRGFQSAQTPPAGTTYLRLM